MQSLTPDNANSSCSPLSLAGVLTHFAMLLWGIQGKFKAGCLANFLNGKSFYGPQLGYITSINLIFLSLLTICVRF